ncbi:MAG: hypothetical protein GY778_26595 [bacterium]|nr:hypothetical protein [bacterium]
MDTMKQTFAALLGSWALSGCLTDPDVVYVPDTQEEEADLQDQGDGADDGTARLWHLEGWLPPGSPDLSGDPITPGAAFLAMRKPPVVDGPAVAVVSKPPRHVARTGFRPNPRAYLL